MDGLLDRLLLICPLVFAGGFVDAVSGGGGIISLPAFVLAGLPVHMAYGCNKFISCAGSAASTVSFLKSRKLDLRVAAVSAAAAFLSATVTSRVVLLLSDRFLKILMVAVLPLAMLGVVFKKGYGDLRIPVGYSPKKIALLATLVGVVQGLYDGLIGPGSGTLAIFLFIWLLKYDLTTASGNAKIVLLASTLASLLTFVLAGKVVYSLALPAAAFGVLGNLLGARMAIKKGSRFIRPMMVIIALAVIGKMAYDLFLS